MVANGDRNLEALCKAHLMLKDRLFDVIEDLEGLHTMCAMKFRQFALEKVLL